MANEWDMDRLQVPVCVSGWELYHRGIKKGRTGKGKSVRLFLYHL